MFYYSAEKHIYFRFESSSSLYTMYNPMSETPPKNTCATTGIFFLEDT